VESSVKVSDFTSLLVQAVVSCHLVHPNDADLAVTLIAPDGTKVGLSTGNGGTGDDYGASCADKDRTVFSDSASRPITGGLAPFAGTYHPEEPLGKLRGKMGAEVNGTWMLRVEDGIAGNVGSLPCWSLTLYPAACEPGGGPCRLCADRTIAGAISENSLIQNQRLLRTGTNSTCPTPKACPGLSGTGTRRYDVYPFLNGPSNACITVALRAECELLSAAYLESYDPTSLCVRYLADRGLGTVQEPLLDYSFAVPADAQFVVVVSQVETNAFCPYTLAVTGGSCLPSLDIARAGTNRVVLAWPSFAPDYRLESAPRLGEAASVFQAETVSPVVRDGWYQVTNLLAGTNRFYRLHKP
jgi:subtilisin-like proprotein convertase family protein